MLVRALLFLTLTTYNVVALICPAGFIDLTTACYFIQPATVGVSQLSWQQAEDACQAKSSDAHLVSIQSAAEWELIKANLPVSTRVVNLWTGATYNLDQSVYGKWVGTDPLSDSYIENLTNRKFTRKWACARIKYRTGRFVKFRTLPCSATRNILMGYICEVAGTTSTTTTPTTTTTTTPTTTTTTTPTTTTTTTPTTTTTTPTTTTTTPTTTTTTTPTTTTTTTPTTTTTTTPTTTTTTTPTTTTTTTPTTTTTEFTCLTNQNFVELGNGCYFFQPATVKVSQLSWQQAADACQAKSPNSHLVAIESQEEMSIIEANLPASSITVNMWTGARYDATKTPNPYWFGTNPPTNKNIAELGTVKPFSASWNCARIKYRSGKQANFRTLSCTATRDIYMGYICEIM